MTSGKISLVLTIQSVLRHRRCIFFGSICLTLWFYVCGPTTLRSWIVLACSLVSMIRTVSVSGYCHLTSEAVKFHLRCNLAIVLAIQDTSGHTLNQRHPNIPGRRLQSFCAGCLVDLRPKWSRPQLCPSRLARDSAFSRFLHLFFPT